MENGDRMMALRSPLSDLRSSALRVAAATPTAGRLRVEAEKNATYGAA